MRIAQVAPLHESVPPKLYGGTERVVAYLCDELVTLGHDVTLFASGDSNTLAELAAVVPRALRLDPSCRDDLAPHILLLERVKQRANEFDVVHFHVDYLHFPVSRRMRTPHLTTLHGRLDVPELAALYTEFSEQPVVSISDAQRAPLPQANWWATVHHGLPRDLYSFHAQPDDYFVFVGRISPEKGVDVAIEIAKRVGVRLKIAAKVSRSDEHYFHTRIAPLLDDPLIEFIGEVNERQKRELLGRARASFFMIDWPEPFGLTMIEAMACGTPVIAFDRGSVPEVLEAGVTGFVVEDIDAAVEAARQVHLLDRRACRRAFERRFLASRMARQYVEVYEQMRAQEHSPERKSGTAVYSS